MLQNLANKPSYAKEEYMIMLNPFVENNKQRINKFLMDLCEVGDFYESLEVNKKVLYINKRNDLNVYFINIYNILLKMII